MFRLMNVGGRYTAREGCLIIVTLLGDRPWVVTLLNFSNTYNLHGVCCVALSSKHYSGPSSESDQGTWKPELLSFS